jgi:broad specificity phosphatase PhoE
MNVIHLVRHAQASWGSANYDQLSERGYEQAATLGRSWADAAFRPLVQVSGAHQRHLQTAASALAAAGLPVEVQVDAGWDEIDTREIMAVAYPDFDPAEAARSGPSRQEDYLAAFVRAVHRWTGGAYDDEYTLAFASFVRRVTSALERVVGQLPPGADAVVFTSGGPVSACAAALLGDAPLLWPQFCTTVINASVTKVALASDGLRLLSFNEHAHLGEFTYI